MHFGAAWGCAGRERQEALMNQTAIMVRHPEPSASFGSGTPVSAREENGN